MTLFCWFIEIYFGCVIYLDGGGGAAALRQARLRGGEGGHLLGWRAGHAEYSTVQYSTAGHAGAASVTCHVSLATCAHLVTSTVSESAATEQHTRRFVFSSTRSPSGTAENCWLTRVSFSLVNTDTWKVPTRALACNV